MTNTQVIESTASNMTEIENIYYVVMYVNEHEEEVRVFEIFHNELEKEEYLTALKNSGCTNIEMMDYDEAVNLGLYYTSED